MSPFNLIINDITVLRSVYIVYTVLGDVSVYVVGKDEYDELACKSHGSLSPSFLIK